MSNPQPPTLPDDVVLRVDNISKKFCRNLRRSMWYGIQDLSRNLIGLGTGSPSSSSSTNHEADGLRRDEFWALKGIDLEVKKGEILGIIGSNGSGKSTLLRLLTGIFPPDEGEITVKGRVGALIALGAGFHPHMTGLENIYLNGAILGMSCSEIDEKLNEIIDFAGIGDFIHAPVSTYSSGMTVRLGFSIAIHVEPEIMFVDEVLAVGDASFRSRCYEKIMRYIEKGNTVCLVSHDLMGIEDISTRILWLDHGKVSLLGDPSIVLSEYRRDQDLKAMQAAQKGCERVENQIESGEIRIIAVETLNADGESVETFKFQDRLIVRFYYAAETPVKEPYFMVYIRSTVNESTYYCANMLRDGGQPEEVEGRGWLDVDFGQIQLYPGVYRVRAQVRKSSTVEYFTMRDYSVFNVEGTPDDYGAKGKFSTSYTREGVCVPIQYRWGKQFSRI